MLKWDKGTISSVDRQGKVSELRGRCLTSLALEAFPRRRRKIHASRVKANDIVFALAESRSRKVSSICRYITVTGNSHYLGQIRSSADSKGMTRTSWTAWLDQQRTAIVALGGSCGEFA